MNDDINVQTGLGLCPTNRVPTICKQTLDEVQVCADGHLTNMSDVQGGPRPSVG